jgi:hypothetical protein
MCVSEFTRLWLCLLGSIVEAVLLNLGMYTYSFTITTSSHMKPPLLGACKSSSLMTPLIVGTMCPSGQHRLSAVLR